MAENDDKTDNDDLTEQLSTTGVELEEATSVGKPVEITDELIAALETSAFEKNLDLDRVSNREPEIADETVTSMQDKTNRIQNESERALEINDESIAISERPVEVQNESIIISERLIDEGDDESAQPSKRPVEIQNESIAISERLNDKHNALVHYAEKQLERNASQLEKAQMAPGPLLLFNNEVGLSDLGSEHQSRSDSGNVIKNKVLKQAKKIKTLNSPKSKRIHDSITKVFGNDDPPPGFGLTNPKYYYLEQKRPQPIQPLKVIT
jgi:hypothetical protein